MPTWSDVLLGGILAALLTYVSLNIEPPGWLQDLAGRKAQGDEQIEHLRQGDR